MKRIITCSDGTWNRPGTTDRGVEVKTNVEKMYNCICSEDKKGIAQVKVYDQGVGTGYTFRDKIFGGLTGAGIDKNIKDVYTFIVLNYEPKDELYLMGFSRGAYTARSLGGLIRNCGILKPENLHLLDKAYEFYRDHNQYTTPDSDMMRSFRKKYCLEEETGIKFIGVWDTVGSLGIPLKLWTAMNKGRYQFHDVTLSSHVDHAYHALAIDDKRALFAPTLWEKSNTVMKASSHKQKMEQRWFCGVHSNIGGGYADCGLSDIALKWMIEKAQDTGLCFYEEKVKELKPDPLGELRNSYTPTYWLWPPKRRTIDCNNPLTNQVIDESVWKRYEMDPSYRPPNLKIADRKY